MRRLLLTTALCAIAAPALAQMEVKVGGATTFQAGWFLNDAPNSVRRDFQSESEVHITAKGTSDAGLEYGVRVEVQTSTSDSLAADEGNIFLTGGWGRLELGDQDGAASELAELAPHVGMGQVKGSYIDFIPGADRGIAATETAGDSSLKAYDTADATKLTYYSPRLEGFQAGISFAPERDDAANGEDVSFSNASGNHDNAVELGLNWRGDLGPLKARFGGGYNFASAKSGSTLDDIRAYSLGGQLSYESLTLGAGYTNNGTSGQTVGLANADVTGWNLGLTYATAPWGVGISYAEVDFDENARPFDVSAATGSGGTYQVLGLGGFYAIAPGLTAAADLVFFERNRVTGADTNGHVAITEIRAVF